MAEKEIKRLSAEKTSSVRMQVKNERNFNTANSQTIIANI